jgi:hypothetical protein
MSDIKLPWLLLKCANSRANRRGVRETSPALILNALVELRSSISIVAAAGWRASEFRPLFRLYGFGRTPGIYLG